MIVASLPAVRQPDFLVAASDAGLSPYMLGVLDAERGELCVPEMYFTKRGQMCEYAEGYESVAGETVTTRQVLDKPQALNADEIAVDASVAAGRFSAMLVAMVGDDEMHAMIELADLREGREDNEFWSRGQW